MSARLWMIGTLLVMPICLGTGCASGTQTGLRGERSMASSETSAETETPPPTQKKTSNLPFKKKRNPFGGEAEESNSSEVTSDEANIDSAVVQADIGDVESINAKNGIEQIGDTSTPGVAKSSVSHDAELLKRINTELKDLPAKERAELFHNLKSLDPAMVDQVLKMRRMSQNISEQAVDSSSPVAGGGYSLSSPNDSTFDVTTKPRSGLGSGDPWGASSGPKTETVSLGEMKPIQAPPRKELQLPRITPSTAGRSLPDLSGNDDVERSPPTGIDFGELNSDSHAGLTPNVQESLTSGTIVFPPESDAGPDSGVINVSTSNHVSPRNGQESIEILIAATEQELAKMPLGTTVEEQRNFVEKHVFLRMLYWMGKQQERALQPIPGIDSADQEFWQQVFWAMTNYFDAQTIPDEADRAAQTLVQLRTAVQRLQEKAKLEIHNVAFCHKISSFGNYERFNKDEFTPGQPVLLYGEMVNFKSEPTADGQYRTIMKSTLEIYRTGPQGQLVERYPFGATEDLCRQPRTDYYHTYEFTIPPRITLGPHVLKLVVEDQLSQKVATYSINFMVK